MPTIEIISVNADALPMLPEYRHFAWRGSTELCSDRLLFQPALDRFKGAIVHLGDRSDHPGKPSWFCGHIIKKRSVEEDWSYFQFKDDAKAEIADLLERMEEASPEHHIIFLTDFQLGPEEPLECQCQNRAAFWAQHDQHWLRHNTLYHIGRATPSPIEPV